MERFLSAVGREMGWTVSGRVARWGLLA